MKQSKIQVKGQTPKPVQFSIGERTQLLLNALLMLEYATEFLFRWSKGNVDEEDETSNKMAWDFVRSCGIEEAREAIEKTVCNVISNGVGDYQFAKGTTI